MNRKKTKVAKKVTESTSTKTEKKHVAKKRNWAFVLYPESAPTDWIGLLQQTGLQCAISPLHDEDVEADGTTLKKPHYHVIACYAGPTSFFVVEGLTKSLNCPIPIALEQIRGYYRYLTHKDNPDKVQYDESGIQFINGFVVSDFVEITRSEVEGTLRQLEILIEDEKISEYGELMKRLRDEEFSKEWSIASNHTYFLSAIIQTQWHYKKELEEQEKEFAIAKTQQDSKRHSEKIRKELEELENNSRKS